MNDVLKGIAAARLAGFSPIKINCVINGSSSEEDASEVRRYGEENELEVRFINRMDLHKGIFRSTSNSFSFSMIFNWKSSPYNNFKLSLILPRPIPEYSPW